MHCYQRLYCTTFYPLLRSSGFVSDLVLMEAYDRRAGRVSITKTEICAPRTAAPLVMAGASREGATRARRVAGRHGRSGPRHCRRHPRHRHHHTPSKHPSAHHRRPAARPRSLRPPHCAHAAHRRPRSTRSTLFARAHASGRELRRHLAGSALFAPPLRACGPTSTASWTWSPTCATRCPAW